MAERRTARLVGAALRCYPAQWRQRHGDEAAELAALLVSDGTPAGSVACSYLAGAARAWLTRRPGRRLSTVAGALLVAAGSAGASAGMLASAAPAKAAPAQTAWAQGGASSAGVSAPCRPGPLTGADDRQLIIWAGGYDRSC